MLSGALFGGYYYYNADNAPETEIRVAEADAGVIYQPSEVLRPASASATPTAGARRPGQRRARRGRARDRTGAARRLLYMLPDLTLTGDARWTTAAAEDNHFSGSLGGFYTLPRGTLRGRIYQRATGDSTGNEVRVTGATIGLVREINTVSRLGLDFGWATQVNLEDDTDEPDITRTDFIASYAYDLTASVTAEVGYNYQTRDEDPIDTDSHRVFLVLGRTFETGL